MIVTRLRPVRRATDGWDADEMRREMMRLADAINESMGPEPESRLFPLVNVSYDADRFYVRAELPGVRVDDLDVTAMGNRLTIAGTRQLPVEGEAVSYHRREREGGAFSRSIQLPDSFDRDRIDAPYEHGVLTMTLPRLEEAKPRRITVRAS